jgi:hypothetical protein
MNSSGKITAVTANDFNGFRFKICAIVTVILYLNVQYVSANSKRIKQDG